MAYRIPFIAGAIGSGMLAAAFLSAAVAVADDGSDGGAAAADVGLVPNHVSDIEPGFSLAPLFETAVSDDASFSIWPDDNIADHDWNSDDLIGQISGSLQHTEFLGGVENTSFVVGGDEVTGNGGAVDGFDDVPDDFTVPTEGSVYSVTDFGGGFENVYTAVPGDESTEVNDTLITPFGNFDLGWLVGDFDASGVGTVGEDEFDPAAALGDAFNPISETGFDFDGIGDAFGGGEMFDGSDILG